MNLRQVHTTLYHMCDNMVTQQNKNEYQSESSTIYLTIFLIQLNFHIENQI